MPDHWDDSDEDDWDVDEDQLEKNLNLKQQQQQTTHTSSKGALPTFDDEEDLTLTEKERAAKMEQDHLKKKGNALASKRRAQKEEADELEIARKAIELEAAIEANMTPDQLRKFKQLQIEEADHKLTDELFGNNTNNKKKSVASGSAGVQGSSSGDNNKLVMNDIKDHLRHARKVSDAIKAHGKSVLASTFIKEVIQESKDVLDDDAITEIIKVCNVLKNELVQAAKRKVKGQPQKSKKVDKAAEAKARQKLIEAFGDNDKYDAYDQMGDDFEDGFF